MTYKQKQWGFFTGSILFVALMLFFAQGENERIKTERDKSLVVAAHLSDADFDVAIEQGGYQIVAQDTGWLLQTGVDELWQIEEAEAELISHNPTLYWVIDIRQDNKVTRRSAQHKTVVCFNLPETPGVKDNADKRCHWALPV